MNLYTITVRPALTYIDVGIGLPLISTERASLEIEYKQLDAALSRTAENRIGNKV